MGACEDVVDLSHRVYLRVDVARRGNKHSSEPMTFALLVQELV